MKKKSCLIKKLEWWELYLQLKSANIFDETTPADWILEAAPM